MQQIDSLSFCRGRLYRLPGLCIQEGMIVFLGVFDPPRGARDFIANRSYLDANVDWRHVTAKGLSDDRTTFK